MCKSECNCVSWNLNSVCQSYFSHWWSPHLNTKDHINQRHSVSNYLDNINVSKGNSWSNVTYFLVHESSSKSLSITGQQLGASNDFAEAGKWWVDKLDQLDSSVFLKLKKWHKRWAWAVFILWRSHLLLNQLLTL